MKVDKVLKLVSYVMIGIGIFSIVTGFASALGFSDSIADSVGGETLFKFINGGVYFMICGAIHIAVAVAALYKINKMQSKILCVILGIITLAWQLAAFIYLLTLGWLSLRAAAMVLMPAIYFIVSGIGVVKEITASDSSNNKSVQKNISTRKNFFNFNFSFKRKQFGGFHFKGKRRSAHVQGRGVGKRKHRNRINIKRMR